MPLLVLFLAQPLEDGCFDLAYPIAVAVVMEVFDIVASFDY